MATRMVWALMSRLVVWSRALYSVKYILARSGYSLRKYLSRGLTALIAAVWLPSAHAQEAAPVCAATAAPVGVLAPWATPVDMQAEGSADGLTRATLAIGQAARLHLRPTPEVRYKLQPEKPGGSVSHGGLIGVEVVQAGTYRIALGSPAWIDLVGDAGAVESIAHGHGPACTGIRKMVDFALRPGRYVVQISANGEPQTSLLIVRLP